MKAIALFIVLVATTASAQSPYPACGGSDVSRWSDCFGTATYPNGEKYVGEFRDGKAHGQGTFNYGVDGKYVGWFREAKRHGLGTYFFKNGDKYVGEYKENNEHGRGIRSFADGRLPLEGRWQLGRFVSTERVPDRIAGRIPTVSTDNKNASSVIYKGSLVAHIQPRLGLGWTSANYGDRVAEHIKPKVALTNPVSGNPSVLIEVRADTKGRVVSRRLVESSGNQSWDEAILLAIDRTGTLPKDTNGRVPPTLTARLTTNAEKSESVGKVQNPNNNADKTPSTQATVAIDRAYGPSANYGGVVAARIKPHVTLADPITGNPRAEVDVRSDTNGRIISRRLVSSSGNRLWDEAVLRAIDLMSTLPRDTDGRVPSALIIGLRPNDAKPDALSSMLIPDHSADRAPSTPPTVVPAPRQTEPPRSTLALSLSTSQANADGVVTINITTNSDTASLKINGDEEGGRADGRYSVNRFAKVGSNSFEVIATDRYGNTTRQSVVVNREVQVAAEKIRSLNPNLISAAKPRDAVAIIIGIEKYKRVPDADFANNDASTFYDYARRALGIKPDNIRLLVDDKADASEIFRAFKTWLPTVVNKNTTDVYVFYSGHGLPSEDGGSLYFLPHEVDRDLLDRTAITQKEVVQHIQRTTPKSVTMFIDSCYSGQSRTGTSLLASARPISIAPKASTDFPSNFMVISASAPDQISSSSPELKHGIFSYYLMLGMEGEADVNKDGQITVGEMQTYLSQQVTRRAIGMNRTQSPQTTGDLNRVLVQASSKTR